jgi:hypothetical protein
MKMQPIEPDRPLSATLSAQQWNVVFAALQKLPYEMVAPIIPRLAEQLTVTSMTDAPEE